MLLELEWNKWSIFLHSSKIFERYDEEILMLSWKIFWSIIWIFLFRMELQFRKQKTRNLLPHFFASILMSSDSVVPIQRPLLDLLILGDSSSHSHFPIFVSRVCPIYLRYSRHLLPEPFSFGIHLNVWRQLIKKELQHSRKIELNPNLNTMPCARWSVVDVSGPERFANHYQEKIHA